MKKPLLLNSFPVSNGRTDFAVSEILRQKEEVGLTHFLLSLSFHPQTTPARDLIPRLCGQFAAVRDGLAGKGVELGVLVQSLQGHGWNGKVPLTREPWGHTVAPDGAESPRMCLLDPGFRAYALDCIRAIVAERPALLLIDDDFGLRREECFCPLHIAKVNEALGTAFSREEVADILRARPWNDPLAARIAHALRDTAYDYARDIRAVIDAAAPSLRCGLCISYTGDFQANAAAHALAGATEPLLRVHDDIYGDVQTDCFPIAFLMASRVMFQLDGVRDILDEADTFPHNYMSVSAAAFHSHIVMALLSGMSGCKLWTSEYEKPVHTGSQARYERKLRDYRGFYRELCAIAPAISWRGLSGLAYRPPADLAVNPFHSPEGCYNGNWETPIECMYALPLRYEALDSGGISTLRGCDADKLSDDQLRTLLAHDVVVDSPAARQLTARGFGPLMGVEADAGDADFFFSVERTADGALASGYMWDDTTARLRPLSDEVEIPDWFCQGERRAFPAATLFRNALGGSILVLGWSLELVYHKMFRPARRNILLALLDRLNGGLFEMAVENGEKALVRHGVLQDGREILSVTSLGADPDDTLSLRLARTPSAIERLMPDGSWVAVPFRRDDATRLVVDVPVVCYDPIMLRFAFE